MTKRYQVSDGKMVLTLKADSDGWFIVTSPIDPAMITQARTIDEAFVMARDAFAALADSRQDADRWTRPVKKRSAIRSSHRPVGAGI
jgi:predicted RNase H-like HicB family nuclease